MRKLKGSIEKLKKKSCKNTKNPKIYLVWSEGLNKGELKKLREQVNIAQNNPDYCIVSNYPLNCEVVEIKKDAKFRFVSSANINKDGVEDLKEQVEKALSDPNFVIITNYEVTWTEVTR